MTAYTYHATNGKYWIYVWMSNSTKMLHKDGTLKHVFSMHSGSGWEYNSYREAVGVLKSVFTARLTKKEPYYTYFEVQPK